MKKIFKQAGMASLLAIAMSNAMAVPSSVVPGQWTVTYYDEPGLTNPGSQKFGICFKQNGTFYSTKADLQSGYWFLKGDRMRWYGHYEFIGSKGKILIATAQFGQFSSSNRMSGEVSKFVVEGSHPMMYVNGNYYMTKVSSRCFPTVP